MKQKRKKRGRVLAVLLAVMVLITSFSFNMVSAEENAEADKVQSETIADPSSNVAEQQDVTDGDKEPEKDVEKDLETERQMKQLLKEIGVGFAESDAQANTSSMQRRAKAARAAGDVINTGRIKSNSIGRIDVINYNDPSWPQILTWREGLLGNTDTKEPLFCADPMDSFKAGKKTGVDASTIYNKETIQTVAAMMYYYDHYMCKSINSDYEYLMKQCAVWWVLNAVHGWFADGVQIETGNGVKCACGTWLSTHKGDYYANGLVWAWENYKYFLDAKGVIYQGNGQPLSSWSGTYNPSGYAKLKKSSSDTSITNGNDCYSLKDATYGVYSEKSLSGASKVGTLTTDANGDSNTLTLTAGTYYVKEVTAPKGYALDKTTYTITVKSGETSVLKVSDKPTMDPVGVLLGKVDKETNLNKPEGSLPLKGALFKVKFYAGVQMDSDPAASGKTVTKKWVFRTDADGFAYYDSQYLVSGDELYTGPTGSKQLPLGTITIKETQAPEGYLINPTVYTVKITSGNNGSEFVYTYNEPTIAEQSLDLNIVKKEKGKDYAIKGAVFEHTKPDGSTETVTTDANGACKFKSLGYGQHKVREVSVPDEYTVNSGVVTFTVAKDNTITLNSNTAKDNSMQFEVEKEGTARLGVEDTLAPYQLKVTKVNEKGKLLEGAEFTIYEDADCTKEVSKIVTDSTGVATTSPLEVEKKYYIKETKAPQGYRIPKDAKGNDYVYEIYTKFNDKREYEYYVNGELRTKDSEDYAIEGTPHERIVNLKVENHTGNHATLILIVLGLACMAVAIIRQMKKGNTKEKENEKNDKI